MSFIHVQDTNFPGANGETEKTDNFSCPVDDEQDWQPYPVDGQSATVYVMTNNHGSATAAAARNTEDSFDYTVFLYHEEGSTCVFGIFSSNSGLKCEAAF